MNSALNGHSGIHLKGAGWSHTPKTVFLGLLIIISVLLFVPLRPPWPKVLEAALYLLCFLLLMTQPALRRLLASLSRTQRWSMMSLAGILLIAQIRDRPQQTFPFIPWNMYNGRFREPPCYLEFVGVQPNGREITIPAGQVFSSQQRAVLWRLQLLRHKMETARDASMRQQSAAQFQALLLAVIRRYREQHPHTALVRLKVIQCTLPRPAPGLKLDVTRRLCHEYPLS